MSEDKRINCFNCEYYYVTWEQAAPRGCRKYGFKSRDLPSLVVSRNSGSKCLSFKEKNKKKNSDEVDLNDERYWK